MPRIPSITERQLGDLTPARLDEDFLDRLTACAEDTQVEISDTDLAFEETLRGIRPRAIPSALQASLLEAIRDTPFAMDEKIVLFHKATKAQSGGARTRRFFQPRFAAAAAVALLGAASAFLIPGAEEGKTKTASGYAGSGGKEFSSHFAPASFGRNLSETRDEGVVWQGKNRPHRVLRLTYMDKVTMKNEKGETFQVERPRYEYVIVPEKID